eukprot:15350001-Ditylum_brightwellii.AAC.2
MDYTNNFILWAWGVGAGQVSETRYSVIPDDGELQNFSTERHQLCILPPMSSNTHQNNSSSENLSVLRQLSESISRQNEHATTTNKLIEDNMSCIKEKDNKRKTG